MNKVKTIKILQQYNKNISSIIQIFLLFLPIDNISLPSESVNSFEIKTGIHIDENGKNICDSSEMLL
ncbi:MAG: hypothetical protein MJ212_03925 [Alphaproteobacteria bacterium]|nr:hypothetical protein [Alphaproteobacteria bacterium]